MWVSSSFRHSRGFTKTSRTGPPVVLKVGAEGWDQSLNVFEMHREVACEGHVCLLAEDLECSVMSIHAFRILLISSTYMLAEESLPSNLSSSESFFVGALEIHYADLFMTTWVSE